MKTEYHNNNDGTFTLNYVEDVESVVEAHKAGCVRRWLSKEKEMMAIAEIPVIALMQWAKRRGINFRALMEDDREMQKFLKDPDNSLWRIR